MAKIIFILSSVVLFAAVGTTGSNGATPYLTLSSKYVGDTITITVNDAPQSFETIYYLFNTNDDFLDWSEILGEGGYILNKDGLVIKESNSTFMEVKPAASSCGKTYNVQAVIKEVTLNPQNVKYTVSRPYSVKLGMKYNTTNMAMNFTSCVPHLGEIRDMVKVGNHLYCASAQLRLAKLGCGTGGTPAWLGYTEGGMFTLEPEHVLASSKRIVLTDRFNSIGIADISDAGKLPQFIGELDYAGYAFCDGAVCDMGAKSYAILAARNRGLAVVDVTSASEMGIVSELLTTEDVLAAQRLQDHLFVLTASSKGYVYDLANTPNIQLVAEFNTPSVCDYLKLSTGCACLLSKTGSDLYVYDVPSNISNSNNVQLIQNLPLDGVYDFLGLTFGDQHVYMFSEGAVHTMKIELDKTLSPVGVNYVQDEVTDLALDQNLLFIAKAGYQRGVETYDLNGFQQLPSPDYNLKHTYVGDLTIVDAEVNGSDYSFAYIMDGSNGMRVVDVTDVDNPKLVNTICGKTLALTTYGDKLVYAVNPRIIKVCSIVSEMGDLNVECEVSNNNKAMSLTMRGDDLFIADNYDGLLIYDLSDLSAPELVTQFEDSTACPKVYNVAVSGYKAFISGSNGVCALDISQLDEPFLVQTCCNYGTACKGSSTDGFNLFVADEAYGVAVFDVEVSFLNNGTEILETFNSYDYSRDVAIDGNLACCAFTPKSSSNINNHVDIYDITNPSAVYCVKSLEHLPGSSYGVALRDRIVYLTDSESLLNIIKVD